jgi:hypothetical protein
MKLWLLSQDVNINYDTYDSCVVVEETAEKAKRVHPNGFLRANEKGEFGYPYGSDWVISVENVNAKYIGEADSDLKAGDVICASYNAG